MHSTRAIRTLALGAVSALVAGTALLGPVPTAQAADAFTNLTISGLPTNIAIPASPADVSFSVSFAGPAVSSDLYYAPYDSASNYATVAAMVTNGAASVSAPYVSSPTSSAFVPGTPITYTMSLTAYKTPGHYRLTVPVQMRAYNKTTGYEKTDQIATAEFDLVASPAVTLAQSSIYGSGKFSKKAKWAWRFNGPDYVKGSTIKVYYQAKGKKKYVVVASAKLNATGDAAFKGKKGSIRKKGKAYFVLSAVPFSPTTQSGLYLIKKV